MGPVDSVNLYSYAGFDPINFWDPFGLEKKAEETKWRTAVRVEKFTPADVTLEFGPGAGWDAFWEQGLRSLNKAKRWVEENPQQAAAYSGLAAQAAQGLMGLGMGGGLPRGPALAPAGGLPHVPAVPAVPIPPPAMPMTGSGGSSPSPSSPGEQPSPAGPEKKGQKLNLGSGDNPMDDAINLDLKPGEGVDVRGNVNKLPFPSGSMSEVNAINPYGYNPVSRETARVMQPGGLLRVTGNAANRHSRPMTPDAAKAMGFEVVETTPMIDAHGFGTQRLSSGQPLKTSNSTTTVYRRLP